MDLRKRLERDQLVAEYVWPRVFPFERSASVLDWYVGDPGAVAELIKSLDRNREPGANVRGSPRTPWAR